MKSLIFQNIKNKLFFIIISFDIEISNFYSKVIYITYIFKNVILF